MEVITGSCLYCGQQQTIRVGGKISEDKANLIATENCCCDGALKARTAEETLSRIEALFGEGCREMGFEYACDVDQKRTLRTISEAVLLKQFEEIKVKLPNGDTASFKPCAGMVEISREMKRKRTV